MDYVVSDAERVVEATEAAAVSIPAVFRNSPQFASERLSDHLGDLVQCKVETVNPVGCFKGRGSWWALTQKLELAGDAGLAGVVTASSGNFGLGLAYAGRARGVRVTVIVSPDANPVKIDRLKLLGAAVVVAPPGQPARALAPVYARENGLEVILDGIGIATATGAATIAREVTTAVDRRELTRPDVVYVPVGAGSLISGVGSWVKACLPGTRVLGVQAERAPAMTLSWRAGKVVVRRGAGTCADGIDFHDPDAQIVRLMRQVVDDMVLVTEGQLIAAQHELTHELGVTVETAGAAGWAGAKALSPSGTSLIVITGANVRQDEIVWR